jgi:high affinity sulfate transporter 1
MTYRQGADGPLAPTAPRGRPSRWQAPGLRHLRHYHRAWLRPDVVAGVTVAAYLVPQVMAYATIAGLPPVHGIYASLAPLAVYAVLGSSRQMSIGPESTTALMTAAAVAPLAAGDAVRYVALAGALALVVGAFAVVAWLLRLGVVADLLSRPILVGYLAGVAVTMIVSQLDTITGVDTSGGSLVAEVGSLLSGLEDLHWPTLLLALTVLGFLLGLRWVSPLAPGPLIAVLAATAIVWAFDLADRYGLALVGDIPAGLPVPGVPDVAASDLAALALPAVGILVVGFSDNVLTARAFASRNGYRIDPNQELLALGAANVAGGLSQGFPVSSSGSRTAIADSLGSRSQLASLVTLGAVVVVLLVARPVLAQFPEAALGGLVVYAAIRLVDVAEFRRLAAFRRSELVLAFAALVGVLALDILLGVVVAVAVSVLDVLYRVSRPHDAVLGTVPNLAGLHDVDDYPDTTTVPGLVVYRYDSPLFFANAEDFRTRALDAADTEPNLRWFLINAEANVDLDITALDSLDELREELQARGVVLALARVKFEVAELLDRAGFLDRIGRDHVYATLPTALAAYRNATPDATREVTSSGTSGGTRDEQREPDRGPGRP